MYLNMKYFIKSNYQKATIYFIICARLIKKYLYFSIIIFIIIRFNSP